MNARTPLARRVVAALLLVLLTACHSWQPTTVSPQRLIAEDQPSSVRLMLINGDTVTVENATLRNDSIVGATDAGAAAVASRDVRSVEVRSFSAGKTFGVVGLLAAVGIGIYFIALCAGDSPYISC